VIKHNNNTKAKIKGLFPAKDFGRPHSLREGITWLIDFTNSSAVNVVKMPCWSHQRDKERLKL
jgi:hypothetical protein